MKKCSGCQEEKDENEFYFRSDTQKYFNKCKECKNTQNKKYSKENKIKINENKKQYYKNNRDRIKEYEKEYYQENKEKVKKRCSQYRSQNIDKYKEYMKQYYQENKDKLEETNKQYRKNNKGKIKSQRKQYFQDNKDKIVQKSLERRRNSIYLRIGHNISSVICNAIKKTGNLKNNVSIHEKLDYTEEELVNHLLNHSNKQSWMTKDNYGKYEEGKLKWHIDHIIPHSSFYYTDMDCQAFKDCWALSNLQPLEALENIRKGNKLL